MKIIIAGKGGCGKSTVATGLALGLAEKGKKVLLLDADESNLGLHRLLGVDQPMSIMDHLGGKPGLKQKMGLAFREKQPVEILNQPVDIADLPTQCRAKKNRVTLMAVGKVQDFGEGCACPMGVLSKGFLSNLNIGDIDFVVIDAEAGVEHFGRRLGQDCDLVIGVVDPTYESFLLAGQMADMAKKAGMGIFFVLNKVTDAVKDTMAKRLPQDRIAGALPSDDKTFNQGLAGEALSGPLPGMDEVIERLLAHGPRIKAPKGFAGLTG